MYRGFILDSNILSKGFIESYQMDGEQVICDQKKVVVSSIEPYRTALTIKGQDVVALDAKKIAENIFPKDKYSIFLSHSHADYKDNSSVVKALIGWFKTELCIDVFVDAVIWANISDLLYEMDRAHCLNTVSSPAIFDYRKRNMSTAIAQYYHHHLPP